MKYCYTVTKPGMINLSKGVFTNKKMLFDAINSWIVKNQYTVTFSGALKYERKKFNYDNLNRLLNSLMNHESFMLRFINRDNNVILLEITIQQFNQFIQ